MCAKSSNVAAQVTMKSSEINWRGGKVTWWSLDDIDFKKDLRLQADDLGQDLAQVSYDGEGGHACVDIGWYPHCSADGHFGICVIKEYDWQNPVFEASAWSYDELVKSVNIAAEVALKVTKGQFGRRRSPRRVR